MIDPIAKLHSPSGALLSVYVNRRPAATRAVLMDLLKPYRAVDHPAAKHVRADIDKVLAQADRIESDPAPAVAVFASSADGIFEYSPLPDRVAAAATIGPRPYLRPLRALPRPLRIGVMLADSSHARTYLSTGGALHDLDDLSVERGKDNYGGFAGYQEKRIRSRAEELSHGLWKKAGKSILESHVDDPLDLVVLAGHGEVFEEIHSQLHPYLQGLPRGNLVVDPNALTPGELAKGVAGLAAEERRRRQVELLDELQSQLGRGGQAIAGLAGVLKASNAHAVERLVVAGPFSKPGVMCDDCGWLSRSGEDCPVCSAPTFAVDDVVASALEAVVEAGGKVDVVETASRLDVHGIGALLRFRVL